MKLAEFMASFSRYAADPTPAGLERFIARHPDWHPDPVRVSIYGNGVWKGATHVVELIHEDALLPLPAEVRRELLSAWFDTRPARHFEINHAAQGFAEWLDGRPGLPPWVPPLARLEWAIFTVGAWADEPGPPDGPLHPNPSLTVLQLEWHLCRWLAGPEEQRKAPGAQPDPGSELALVWRDPRTRRARYLRAGDRELLALKVAAEGLSVAQAVAAGASEELLREVLAEAREMGLLCGALPS